MATIILKGIDSALFVHVWRETNAPPVREVICTRCGAKAGEKCKNRSTGKSMKTFHGERHKLEKRVRAIVILRRFGPMTAGGFASRFWPEQDSHFTARSAACFLFTLWQEGLVSSQHDEWGKTYMARRT